jgi:hypothetical protein
MENNITKEKEQLTIMLNSLGNLTTDKNMLSNEQIAKNLMSDLHSYDEFIVSLIIDGLKSNEGKRIYWDAWFRGAESKDLENADAGKIYDKKN